MLEIEEQRKLAEGFELLLKDPKHFRQTYQQPAGEEWKHFLWHIAEQLQEHEEQQRKDKVALFCSEHKMPPNSACAPFLALELCPDLDELRDDFATLDMQVQKQEKEIEHLRATLRAVEQTLNLTCGRVSSIAGIVGEKM